MQQHTRERVLPALLFHLLAVSLLGYGHADHGHTDPILFNTIGNFLLKTASGWMFCAEFIHCSFSIVDRNSEFLIQNVS